MELLNSADIPLQPRPAGRPVPLTALQRRLWNEITKNSTPLSDWRMCAASVRLSGALNISLLEKSIETVVRRHESLRTRIVTVDGVPQQHIDAERNDYFEFADLTNTSPTELEREAIRLGQEFMDKKIDISTGPLFEVKLLKLSEQTHVLIMALDHLVSDAGSYAILNREIWTLYHQAVHKRLTSLPPLPIQFADYAVWQQDTYGSWLKDHEPYWRERLSGASGIQLTPDGGLPEADHPSIARLHFPFGKALSTKLREIAQREQMRLPLVVLTVYVVAMLRWCNQCDLVLTFVSHGRRDNPDLKNMIGFLAHLLHFRIEIDNDDSFLDVLGKVYLEFRSAHQHRDFDRVPDLIPECATELHFNWLPSGGTWSADRQSESDLTIKVRPFPLKVDWLPKFLPLFADTASGINVTVTYRSDLFTPSTIERFGRSLRLVAEEFTQDPLARVSSVALQ